MLLVGLRGVGKTVLLDRIRTDAEAAGFHCVRIEAPEGRSLPAILAPELRIVLLKLSRHESGRELAIRALRGLAGFVKSLKVKYGDIEVGLDYEPEPGLADNGDLEYDLQALLEATATAARGCGTAVVMFIDELQYVPEDQIAALITALHRTAQRSLPADARCGLGFLTCEGEWAKPNHTPSGFSISQELDPYTPAAASRRNWKATCAEEGASIDADALECILQETHCYPYFLQEWGKHAWDIAEKPPINVGEVNQASNLAIAALDESFFRVRFDRLTPSEKKYIRAMAELGAGPHRSGDIANVLGRQVTSLAPTRSQLISKGMIWSPNHGDTAFTVPLFEQFMQRIMPGDSWKD